MKQTLIAPYDLYSLYERVLEGVIVDVTIEYDIEHMLQHGAINDANLKVIKKEFQKDGLAFLKSKPFDKKKILKDIDDDLEDFDTLQETWGEYISDDEYAKIEPLIDAMNNANPTVGIIGETVNLEDIIRGNML